MVCPQEPCAFRFTVFRSYHRVIIEALLVHIEHDLMTDNPIIRRAPARDASALAACIDAAYAKYAERISDMPSVSEGCEADIANNQVWVVAQGEAVIAGLILIAGNGFMKLANLAVHPDHAGQGLGRKLIELCEYEAKRQGFSEMRLNTHVDMPENIRLYQHLGWAVMSRRDNTVSDNTVSMKKHLSGD
jgi:ribosomal protein S18 acetylase RimI-like enzyme